MKKNLWLKILAIALFVATPALFGVAASLYSLGDLIVAIILAVLALACLYGGLITNHFRKKNIKIVEIPEPTEKPKKPFFKRCNVIVLIASFCMVLIASFSGMCFETVGFSVEVKSFTLTHEMASPYVDGNYQGGDYSATIYKPKSASEDNKAPVVFVLPGFTRTKATMSQYCIELARRGAVVFCSDPGGQGNTTETSTAGHNGVAYLIKYVYNNTQDFKYCDKTRIGAMGHSAGGGDVCKTAAELAGSSYATSIIKALYVSGYIKTSASTKFKDLRCDAALSYAYYDEGSYRYQNEDEALETISYKFINDVWGTDNQGHRAVVVDQEYGTIGTGKYRVFHREKTNHCFQMYDHKSITNTLNFFNRTLGMNSTIKDSSQIWFGKEFSNGIALAAALTFIIALCFVLMDTKFFASIKPNKPVAVAEWEAKKKPKSLGKKIFFWTALILTATIACLDYIPLANLSIEIFPTGNASNVFTFVFPARMVNAILLWATINGAIGLVIYFGEMLIDNLIQKIRAKRKNVPAEYNWSKIDPMKVGGKSVGGVFANIGKLLLLCLIMISSFYVFDYLCYLMFHQDFRFMLISAAPINWRMFVTALEYIPLILIFYFSNAIRVNGSVAKEGYSETATTIIAALANSIGLVFILIINYVCFFTTGIPFYTYMGGSNEVWLFINMVFGLVVMMFLLPIFNRIVYKKTGSVWVGAIVFCFIFVMMTVSASVSYIPIY